MNRRTTLCVFVASLVVAGALAAPVAAEPMVTADPDDPETRATHSAVAAVGPSDDSNSWNGLTISYQSTSQNGDVKDVGEDDIVKIGIDREGDSPGTTIDVDVADDVSGVGASNNGESLEISLGGDYNLQEDDEVVVVYEDALNPSAGEHTIEFTVNPQSDGTVSSATLTISEDGAGDGTATPTPTGNETTTPTDGGDSDDEATPSPTFRDNEDQEEEPTDSGSGDDSTSGSGEDATATDAGGTTETATEDGGTDGANATDDGGVGAADDGTDADGPGGTDTAGEPTEQPGFGVVVALAALLGAALLARRRR